MRFTTEEEREGPPPSLQPMAKLPGSLMVGCDTRCDTDLEICDSTPTTILFSENSAQLLFQPLDNPAEVIEFGKSVVLHLSRLPEYLPPLFPNCKTDLILLEAFE